MPKPSQKKLQRLRLNRNAHTKNASFRNVESRSAPEKSRKIATGDIISKMGAITDLRDPMADSPGIIPNRGIMLLAHISRAVQPRLSLKDGIGSSVKSYILFVLEAA